MFPIMAFPKIPGAGFGGVSARSFFIEIPGAGELPCNAEVKRWKLVGHNR